MVGGIRFVWMAKVRDYKFLLKECYQEAFLSHAAFLSCMLLRTCSDCCLVNKILYVCGKFGTCTFPVKERERATKIVQSMPSPPPNHWMFSRCDWAGCFSSLPSWAIL